jgi:hypothetical protein
VDRLVDRIPVRAPFEEVWPSRWGGAEAKTRRGAAAHSTEIGDAIRLELRSTCSSRRGVWKVARAVGDRSGRADASGVGGVSAATAAVRREHCAMKVLLVTSVHPWSRSVSTIQKWALAGRALGHEVAVYGDPIPQLPSLSCTTDLDGVDIAVLVLQVAADLPEMPRLARLLDRVPSERRLVADLWGRFNDTIRVEHDFNHLEKLDEHQGWEWVDAMQAFSATITQPTLSPLRPDVRSFLFHGYDQGSVARHYESAGHAAAAWRAAGASEKPYGAMYIGSNWQRWDQVRRFLLDYEPVRSAIGRACLMGWDWDKRPEFAVRLGLKGIDTDPDLLAKLDVQVHQGVRFDEITRLLSKARFVPVFHRPLFRHLGLVTVRTFETFYADALPVLMLPRDFVAAIYGEAALKLVPGESLAEHLATAMERPEDYWDAVIQTRSHLARHHSFAQRLRELDAIVHGAGRSGVAS